MKVSYFNNVQDTTPKDISLEEWLIDTIKPPIHLKQAVERYRSTKDKKYKEDIPCITVSATFKKYRNLENIKKKTGLLCIDVDRYSKSKKATSNICVDMKLVKELFSTHPSTLYCGLSVSGDGVYVILKIFEAKKLKKYFNHFRKKLALVGINIDANCKDYTRLRFFSYDEDAYYNPEAKPYKIAAKVKTEAAPVNTSSNKSNAEKIEKVLEVIERNGIDVTGEYRDWVKLGGALYSEFGEAGRAYFHRFSKYHSEYKESRCNKKYSQCSKMNQVKLSSLFYVCNSYGVRY
jgi:hypothetical protein